MQEKGWVIEAKTEGQNVPGRDNKQPCEGAQAAKSRDAWRKSKLARVGGARRGKDDDVSGRAANGGRLQAGRVWLSLEEALDGWRRVGKRAGTAQPQVETRT